MFLNSKLCRQSFQKSVPIIQNMLIRYLIYDTQRILFPEHLR